MRLFSVLLLFAALCDVASGERVTVTVLATTDLHGNLYPVDYYTGKPVSRGLAKLAPLIQEVRRENPNTLLVDAGDTIQGSPMEYVYQTIVRTGRPPLNLRWNGPRLEHDPMLLAMNALGYDAMVLGNHELNYGLRNLERARSDARFPWISANTSVTRGARQKPFARYIVKQVGGVKVAVIGITTPGIPIWERPENIGGYRFAPPLDVVRRTVAQLRRTERPDLVILAAHAGLGRDPDTGRLRDPHENGVYEIASSAVDGLEAIVYGHSHLEMEQYRVGKVLLVQPKNWGISLARMDFLMERSAAGAWVVLEKHSRLLRPDRDTRPDPELMSIAQPYHDLTERYLNTPVAQSESALSGRYGRVEDTAIVDAIQTVQLFYSHADVSFTSLFNPGVSIPQGPVTVRQIAALYVYDNELYSLEGTGKMVKDALENSARYFASCEPGACSGRPLINKQVMGFNYDMAEGVSYDIDLTRPEGDRVRNLRWRERPLAPGQRLLLAVNNYRAAGSAGYDMFADAKVVWRSSEDIRDLMVRYYTEHRQLPSRASGNWRVVPAEAVRTLERQAEAEAAHPRLQ